MGNSIVNVTGTRLAAGPSARTAAGYLFPFFGTPRTRSPETPGLTRDSTLQVVVVETAAELEDHAAAWQDLADHAMECNAFYEPWMFIPAVNTLGKGKSLRFVFVYETNPHDCAGTPRLQGFFPLELLSRFRELPIRAARLWKHLHCFLCTPLVRAERAGKTLAALLDWAARDPRAGIVDFSLVGGDGPFHRLLMQHADETGSLARVTSCTTRAMWKRGENLEVYLSQALSGGIRKEYRRQRRRLGELGQLEFVTLRQSDAAQDWIESFMHLEASGWKAREGTALRSNADQHAYIREVARNGFARGQVLLHGLLLDGQPVAMLLSFHAGGGNFAFKIAYDESFAKYSPGVQVTLDVLAQLHADSRCAWIDSCAESDHSMINRLLTDRRTINTVLVSTGTLAGDLLISAYPAGKWLNRLIRRKGNDRTQSKDAA